MTFQDYLRQKGVSASTLKTYQRGLLIFSTWRKKRGIAAHKIEYVDLLDFLAYCQDQAFSLSYTNQLLNILRHYFTYLKAAGITEQNPARDLHLRGTRTTVAHGLLKAEELQRIFHQYRVNSPVRTRNKVILGMMIFQGLGKGALERMQIKHLDLAQTTVYVTKDRKSNARTIPLEAVQVESLIRYLSEERSFLLSNETPNDLAGRLFVTQGSTPNLGNVIAKMLQQLKKRELALQSAKQLRQSRISIWIKRYGLRKAQYLAGHRYVSSTERYSMGELEQLQKQIGELHPLG
ncbi:MAG: tyrosine-type recombinase/integrase [Bacteroidota bacterium]